MQQDGYALIKIETGAIIQRWGMVIPNVINLPDLDTSWHPGTAGDERLGFKFVETWVDDPAPGKWFRSTGSTDAYDGEKVVTTVSYPATPNVVPDFVENYQGRAMLRMTPLAGGGTLFDAVQAAINGIADPIQKANAQDAFDRAPFSRTSPLLNAITAQVWADKTPDERAAMADDMFRAGADYVI